MNTEVNTVDLGGGLIIRILRSTYMRGYGFVLEDTAGEKLDACWGFQEEEEAARAGKQSAESLTLNV
jgi:hypothetical protein